MYSLTLHLWTLDGLIVGAENIILKVLAITLANMMIIVVRTSRENRTSEQHETSCDPRFNLSLSYVETT